MTPRGSPQASAASTVSSPKTAPGVSASGSRSVPRPIIPAMRSDQEPFLISNRPVGSALPRLAAGLPVMRCARYACASRKSAALSMRSGSFLRSQSILQRLKFPERAFPVMALNSS